MVVDCCKNRQEGDGGLPVINNVVLFVENYWMKCRYSFIFLLPSLLALPTFAVDESVS
jgi:hypothetical protein